MLADSYSILYVELRLLQTRQTVRCHLATLFRPLLRALLYLSLSCLAAPQTVTEVFKPYNGLFLGRLPLLMDDFGQFYFFLHDQQVVFCLEPSFFPLDVFFLGSLSSFQSLLVRLSSLFDLPPK